MQEQTLNELRASAYVRIKQQQYYQTMINQLQQQINAIDRQIEEEVKRLQLEEEQNKVKKNSIPLVNKPKEVEEIGEINNG